MTVLGLFSGRMALKVTKSDVNDEGVKSDVNVKQGAEKLFLVRRVSKSVGKVSF